MLFAAHGEAALLSMLLHRDISRGNLLALPTLVRGHDGIVRVVWKGLLVDWELSEPIEGTVGNAAPLPTRERVSY